MRSRDTARHTSSEEALGRCAMKDFRLHCARARMFSRETPARTHISSATEPRVACVLVTWCVEPCYFCEASSASSARPLKEGRERDARSDVLEIRLQGGDKESHDRVLLLTSCFLSGSEKAAWPFRASPGTACCQRRKR